MPAYFWREPWERDLWVREVQNVVTAVLVAKDMREEEGIRYLLRELDGWRRKRDREEEEKAEERGERKRVMCVCPHVARIAAHNAACNALLGPWSP